MVQQRYPASSPWLPATFFRALPAVVLAGVALAPSLAPRADEIAAMPPADGAARVAGPGAESSPEGPGTLPPEPDLDARRAAAQERYLRLMAEERYPEAVSTAVEVVELTRQRAGKDSPALARPLTNLATAQVRAGDLLAAESNYLAALALIERHEGILSPSLENSLSGLGDTYLRAGQYGQAISVYQRALRVSQVNGGLYHPGQFPIRDALSEGYLGTGDLQQANFHQKFQVQAEVRRLGAADAGTAPALYKLGAWYERTGQPEAARMAYQQVERTIIAARGPDDPALADAALAIAGTFRQQSLAPADPTNEESPLALLPLAATTLRNALAIVDRQPEPDPARRARILVELGDIYLLLNRPKAALDNYVLAWNGLAGDEDSLELRQQLLGNPAVIAGPEFPTVYPRKARKEPGTAREPGHVLLRYAVNERGLVEEAAVVESDPSGLLDGEVLSALRSTLFRPRFQDGVPTRSDALLRRHEFRYQPGEARTAEPPATEDRPLAEPGSPAGDTAGGG